jgi:hypothetical protein
MCAMAIFCFDVNPYVKFVPLIIVIDIFIVIITLPLGLRAFEQRGCESSHSKNSLGLNPLKPP